MSEAGPASPSGTRPGSQVVENGIRYGADGIFVRVSKPSNLFRGNTMRDLRFAVHYMYTNMSEVSGNVSIGNHIGYAIMMSDRLKVVGNRSEGDRDHGLLFNYANRSKIERNVVTMSGGREGSASSSTTPISTTSAATGSRAARSGSISPPAPSATSWSECLHRQTQSQVKYVGTRFLDWSEDGRGNYWSDNPAFDLDGDGIADNAYRPNDIIDQVLWTNPSAKLLVTSPGRPGDPLGAGAVPGAQPAASSTARR